MRQEAPLIHTGPTAADLVPRFPGDDDLPGWADISEGALLGMRTLRHDAGVVVVLARREVLWDVVAIRGTQVRQTVLTDAQIAGWLFDIAE